MIANLHELEKILGYKFKDKKLIEKAITHISFSKNQNECYDVLEFFGDAILEFCVSKKLFFEFGNDKKSGQLTQLRQQKVNKIPLSVAFDTMDLCKYVRADIKQELSEKTKSDFVEAIIAAIYLDSNSLDHCNYIIDKYIEPAFSDYKSVVFEYFAKNKIPYSLTTKSMGPNHSIKHNAILTVNKKEYKGTGSKKHDAEREACKEYLKINIKEINKSDSK